MWKDFLSNYTLMTTLIFLLHQFGGRFLASSFSSSLQKSVYGAVTGTGGALLMLFSIRLPDGQIMDLRHIPLMFTALYGGLPAVLTCSCVLIIARFLTGPGPLKGVLFIVLSAIGYVLIVKLVKNHWTAAAVMMTFSAVVFALIATTFSIAPSVWQQSVVYYTLFSIGGGLLSLQTAGFLRKRDKQFQDYRINSYTDSLTGLHNVRRFQELFEKASARAERYRSPVSLALVDIDYFKKVNDTYGHTAGDAVLKQLAAVMTATLPSYMPVSRNGGEEFTVIIEKLQPDEAEQLMNTLRQAVSDTPFWIAEDASIFITISIGIASYPEQPLPDLYESADEALYTAKQSGRNCVKVVQLT